MCITLDCCPDQIFQNILKKNMWLMVSIHRRQILHVFPVSCSAHEDSVYTPPFIFPPTQHPEVIATDFYISPSRIRFSGKSDFEIIPWKYHPPNPHPHSWRNTQTLILSSKKFANKFPAAQARPDFCSASIRIAKFQWLTLQPSSLFPGETEERSFPLLMSGDQTTWRSAGRWGLCRSHIFCHPDLTNYLFDHKRQLQKATHIGRYLWLSSLCIIWSWWGSWGRGS